MVYSCYVKRVMFNTTKVKTVYDSMHCYICSLNNKDCVCNMYTSRPVLQVT